jgi:NAD(P)-dependent dehydrogenase (short-subunit alcohol dehydrogenase family)
MVTGASRGIGLELTRQALVRGDRVVAATRRPSADVQARSTSAASNRSSMPARLSKVSSTVSTSS